VSLCTIESLDHLRIDGAAVNHIREPIQLVVLHIETGLELLLEKVELVVLL
jgi:hypothetical protein